MTYRKPQQRDDILHLIVCFIVSMAVFASCPVGARASDDVNEEPGDKVPMISTSVSLEQTEDANIDGTDASVGYTEFAVGLEWQFLLFDIDHREYNWENNLTLDGDPGIDHTWKSLTRIAPGLQYYQKFGEKWGVWPKLVAIAGFEDEISSHPWTYNPQVIGFYMPTRQITIYGGLGMLCHTVESVVYPVLGVAWNMETKNGLSGAVGFPETMLRYGFNERVALKMDFEYDIRYYHLADDNNLTSGGYIKTEDLIPGLYIEYEPIKELILRFGIRRYFGRKLTVFDDQENELTSNDVSESSAYLLGVDYKF